MFTLYTVLLAIHILAVAAWLGSGLFAFLLSTRLTGDDGVRLASAISGAAAVFPIAGMVAALAGIGLWIDGPWGLDQLWLWIAVVGWVASSAIGGAQVSKAVERWAAGDLAAVATYQRFARIDLVVLTVVVVDMVMKPGA